MKLTIKIAGVALAAAALCGLGAATATAATTTTTPANVPAPASANTPGHTPGQLRDGCGCFGVYLENDTSSPVTIYTYQGDDWDYEAYNPDLGTVISPGQKVEVVLVDHASAVDAVGVGATGVGNLGLAVIQDNWGDWKYQINGGTSFTMTKDNPNGVDVWHMSN